MKNLSFKAKYIIYGVLMLCAIVWLIVGSRFVTLQSDGMVCFFALTLPFLILIAAFSAILYTLWRQYRIKKQKERENNKR